MKNIILKLTLALATMAFISCGTKTETSSNDKAFGTY